MTSAGRRHHTVDDVLELVLGGERRWTREEIVAKVGIPLEEGRRIWRALGFPDVGDVPEFTDADVAALMATVGLVRDGHLDVDGAVEIVRAIGQTTARLAEWQAGTFSRVLSDRDPEPEGPLTAADVDAVHDEARAVLPALETMLVHTWRRQLAAVMYRELADATPADEGESVGLTVGFADLVGFTRLARRLPDHELATVVESFEATSADVVAATGARLVKTLGDEVLFVSEDPVTAASIALRLHLANARDQDVPDLRIGLATGQVLSRMGDVFGTTVNLAARLTAMAHPGSTLCDRTTAELLSDSAAARSGRLTVRAITPRPLRGLGLVRPFVVAGEPDLEPLG